MMKHQRLLKPLCSLMALLVGLQLGLPYDVLAADQLPSQNNSTSGVMPAQNPQQEEQNQQVIQLQKELQEYMQSLEVVAPVTASSSGKVMKGGNPAPSDTGSKKLKSPPATEEKNTYDLKVSVDEGGAALITMPGLSGTVSMGDVVIDPTHGKLTQTNDPNVYSYTPDDGYSGEDEFVYSLNELSNDKHVFKSVKVDVKHIDHPPTAPDATLVTNDNQILSGLLVGKDPDKKDTLTYSLVGPPADGKATVNSDGSFTYISAVNFDGTDSFTYQASDGTLASQSATVFITVHDATAPAISDAAAPADKITPSAATVTWTTNENATSQIEYGLDTHYGAKTTLDTNLVTSHSVDLSDLTANSTIHYRILSQDKNGNLTVGDDKTLTMGDSAPSALSVNLAGNDNTSLSGNLSGTDPDQNTTLTYALKDAASHGTATVNADGSYTYTAAKNYDGTDTFTYTVTDGKLTSKSATVTVTVHDATAPAVSDVAVPADKITPSAATITWTTDEAATSQIEYSVHSDMTGSQTTTLDANLVTSHGVALSNLDANVTYYYRILSKDKNGNRTAGDIKNLVTGDNAPLASDAALAGNDNTPLSGNLSASDPDPNTALTYALAGAASHGSVTVNADGSYTYTATKNYDGPDSFTYTVSDGKLTSKSATVTVTVHDATAPAISDAAAPADKITPSAATVTWTTDEPATSRIEYSINADMTDSLTTDVDAALVTSHSVDLTGLVSGAVYYYRILSKDKAGNVKISDDLTLTTPASVTDITLPVMVGTLDEIQNTPDVFNQQIQNREMADMGVDPSTGLWVDASGQGNNGTLNGGVTVGDSAPSWAPSGSKSLSFDGTSGYVAIPFSASLVPAAAVTFSATIKDAFAANPGHTEFYLNNSQWGAGGWSLYRDSNNNLIASVRLPNAIDVNGNAVSNGMTVSVSASTLTNGDWNQVTTVYDGTTLKLYINGVLKSVSATLAAPTSIDYPYSYRKPEIAIGGRPPADSPSPTKNEFATGSIYGVGVYSTALSAADVAALAAGQSQNVPIAVSSFMTNSTSVKGYYTINGGAAQEVDFSNLKKGQNTLTLNLVDPNGKKKTLEWSVAVVDQPPYTLSPVADAEATNPFFAKDTVSFTTSGDTTAQIQYGLNSNYGTTTSLDAATSSHSITLTNLNPSTTYHYRVIITDASGNKTVTEDRELTTADRPSTYYVGAKGTRDSLGTALDPVDLQDVLASGAAKPGDTIILEGGTYNFLTNADGTPNPNGLVSNLTGTADKPITFMGKPGDEVEIRSKINIVGAYATYEGLEFDQVGLNRISTVSGSAATDLQAIGAGDIDINGSHVNFVNNIVHDMVSNGIGFWAPAVDSVVSGNLIYNNGWITKNDTVRDFGFTGPDGNFYAIHGHGIYTQNQPGSEKIISDNIIFNNVSGYNMHLYGTDASYLGNFLVADNTSFGGNFLVAGHSSDVNDEVAGNMLYNGGLDMFYSDHNASNLNIHDNYAYGITPLILGGGTDISVTHNTFIGMNSSSGLSGTQVYLSAGQTGTDLSQYFYQDNTYVRGRSGVQTVNTFQDTTGANTAYTWSDWQAAGFDTTGTFISNPDLNSTTRLTGVQTFVKPIASEPGRATVSVYNWDLNNTVNVDLSGSGLKTGDAYQIRDAQNYFGAPVAGGIFDAAHPIISIDMTGTTIAQIAGDAVFQSTYAAQEKQHTSQEFGTFIVLPTAGTFKALAAQPGAQSQAVSTVDTGLPESIKLSATAADSSLPTTFSIAVQPNHGTLTQDLQNDLTGATWIYTPDAGFSGKDVFEFRITNGTYISDPATVYVPVNDMISPVVSGVSVSDLTDSTADIAWTTNEIATAQIAYSTNADMDNSQTTTLDSKLVTSHSVALSNLSANTTYYYRILTRDANDNLTTGDIQNFLTYDTANSPVLDVNLPAAFGTLGQIQATPGVSNQIISNQEMADMGVDPSTGLWVDASGEGNNGTLNGGATVGDSAPSWAPSGSKSLSFDGTSGYVAIPFSASLVPSNAITFAANIKDSFATTPGHTEFYLNNSQFGAGGWSLSRDTSNNLTASVRIPLTTVNGQQIVALTASIAGSKLINNDWNSVIATYDGQTLNLYINGVLKASSPTLPTATDITYPYSGRKPEITIGGRPPADSPNPTKNEFAAGSIYGVGVYNTALSAVDVAALAAGQNVPVAVSSFMTSSAAAKGFYTLNGGAVQEADFSGLKNGLNKLTLNLVDPNGKKNTLEWMVTVDTPPAISAISVPADAITPSGATVDWTTNEPATSQIQYGLDTNYDHLTTLADTNPLVANHSVNLSGLTANTTYHYRILTKDAAGNLTTGADQTLMTGDNAPTATAETVSTNQNTATTIVLQGSDPDKDTLTYSIATQPTNGTLTQDLKTDPTGATWIYTPNNGFAGADSFAFKTSDGKKDSVAAEVDITIQSVNNPPTFVQTSDQVANEGTALTFQVSATDKDQSDSLTYSLDQNTPSFITVTKDGSVTVNAASGQEGPYLIKANVSDGKVTTQETFKITVKAPLSAKQMTTTAGDIIPNFGFEPTIVAMKSGNWSDTSIWSMGHVPTSTDIISVMPGVTVNFDDPDAHAKAVVVQNGGQFIYSSSVNTKLTVETFEVLKGGTLDMGDAANPIAANVQAQMVFADTAINTTDSTKSDYDPAQWGHGLLVVDGKVSTHGQTEASTFVKLATEPKAGDTTLTLSTPVSDWQVGDKVTIADSRQVDSRTSISPNYVDETETLTISSISADGKTLTLTGALQYDHLGARDAAGNLVFTPDVAVTSHNVTIKSEKPTDFGNRGIVTLVGRSDVDMEYTSFLGLGRTQIDAVDNTTFDSNGNVTHVGTNEEDRNPIQFRNLVGPSTPQADGYQYTFVGNTVKCPVNMKNGQEVIWGINVNDSSYGLIKDNVLNNWGGAGLVLKTGSEINNVIDHNFVVEVEGTGLREGEGTQTAMSGTAFWLRDPMNTVTNNVAADAHSLSDAYAYGFNISAIHLGTVTAPKSQGADPNAAGQSQQIDMNSTTITAFSDNEVYGTAGGMALWDVGVYGNAVADPNVIGGTIKNLHVWHQSNWGYYGYESNNLTFDGFTVIGDAARMQDGTSTGIWFGDYNQTGLVIKDANIQNEANGLGLPHNATGPTIVQDSYFNNLVDVNAQTMNFSNGPYLPANSFILRDDRFDAPTGDPLKAVSLTYAPMGMNGHTNFIQKSDIYIYNYNGVIGDDFQVFYDQQAADFIVPMTDSNNIGSPEAGLTNQENWDKYGIAISGSVMPVDAVARAGITGGKIRATAAIAQDQTITTPSGRPVSFTLEAVGPDPSKKISFKIVAQPLHGTLTQDLKTDPTGSTWIYTPNAGYTGADSLSFEATDGLWDSNLATVLLTSLAASLG